MSESKAQTLSIFEALPRIMGEIAPVRKDHKNPQQGYQYRSVDDLMASAGPVLAKYGVCIVPRVRSHTVTQVLVGQRQTPMMHVVAEIEYDFCASDGSKVTACALGEATDSGDKAANKAMAAAYKYVLLQTLCVPTDEPKDTEDSHPELASTQPPQQQTRQPVPKGVDDFYGTRDGKNVTNVPPPGEPQPNIAAIKTALVNEAAQLLGLPALEAGKLLKAMIEAAGKDKDATKHIDSATVDGLRLLRAAVHRKALCNQAMELMQVDKDGAASAIMEAASKVGADLYTLQGIEAVARELGIEPLDNEPDERTET